MYIVSVVNIDGKIFEVAVNFNELSPLCDVLENSGDVDKFKVSGSQGEIDQKLFGFYGYTKWHLKFNIQTDVPKSTIKQEVISVICFDDYFTFINEMHDMSKRGESFGAGTVCQIDCNDHKEFIILKDNGYFGAGWYKTLNINDRGLRDSLKEIYNIKDNNVEFVFELVESKSV